MRDIRSAAATGGPVRIAQATAPRPAPSPTPRATPTPKPTPVPKKDELAKADPKKAKTAAVEEECKPAPKKGKRVAAKDQCGKADAKSAKEAALKKKAEPKNPARIWVQVAGGANKGSLPKEWSAATAKAADLKGKGPWTAKNRATNRLLAGPYKSEDDAQAAVAKLRKAGIGAFQWHSDEGEPVDKLGAK
jgi:hypothetical protein